MFFEIQAVRIKRFLRNQLWVRPALASLFSIAVAGLALIAGRVSDATLGLKIDEESLVTLFTIFASSMLTVATFTVSAIVTAASTAASTTTPRAARQVVSDSKAQLVLSAFIAAFIYSFIAIIALKVFSYGPTGRFVLFAGLIALVAFVLASFINWIDHAMKLGRQSTTIEKLRTVARQSITPAAAGTFGARVAEDGATSVGAPVCCTECGYVSSIDVGRLNEAAAAAGAYIGLAVRPGDYCGPGSMLADVVPKDALSEDLRKAIDGAVERDKDRHEDVDIRFNVVNLAETADRALSPAVNDPGTAIYILNVLVELLAHWSEVRQKPESKEVTYSRVSMPPLTAREIVNDAFTPIARDGAGSVEVGVRLQKVLGMLADLPDAELREQAMRMSDVAADLADAALVSPAHKAMVADVRASVVQSASG